MSETTPETPTTMPTATPTNTERKQFLTLLQNEILALEDAKLDFGVYRILGQRREAIESFLTMDLPERLNAVIGAEGTRALERLDGEIADARDRVETAAKGAGYPTPIGPDGQLDDEVAKMPVSRVYLAKIEERAALAAAGGFTRDEEADLYHHLYTFFSRYYRHGDFQPQPRRSRRARYAVPQTEQTTGDTPAGPGDTASVPVTPYNGQDVHLHWRSKGMHYTKTTERFRLYRATEEVSKTKLRFEITTAEGDRDNAKATTDRFFVPLSKQARVEDDGTLVIPFEHRALTEAEKTKLQAKKKEIQDTLLAEAAEAVKLPKGLSREKLGAHLRRYAKRHQWDYFIHPRLGEFLRDEFDHYLKSEYLDLAGATDVATLADRLAKMKALRSIADDLIGLLNGIETFQARLFEKRRFVFSSDVLVPMRLIPVGLHDEILNEPRQLEAWRRDLGLADEAMTADGLSQRPTLPVDTRCFRGEHGANPFRDRLLTALSEAGQDLDAITDGVLVHGENYGALRTLAPRYQNAVKCTYIDPPYNTGGDDFLYKDDFARHSTWLTMMEERLRLGKLAMTRDGFLVVSIDDSESSRLIELLDMVLGEQNQVAVTVWNRNRKNDAKLFSVGHEYMHVYARDKQHLTELKVKLREAKEGVREAAEWFETAQEETGKSQQKLLKAWTEYLSKLQNKSVKDRLKRFKKIDEERGPYRDDGNINWPGGGGPTYTILHPLTKNPVKKPASGWRFEEEETFWEKYEEGYIRFGKDETTVPSTVTYIFEAEMEVLTSFADSPAQKATKRFDALFGRKKVFPNPKSTDDIGKMAGYLAGTNDYILDYFAGSGTTGHAVTALNRADGGRRRFILTEMGEHFETVLVPRMVKVMYAPDWKAGRPVEEPMFGPQAQGDAFETPLPEWIERSPRLVQIVTLESYDDSLDALSVDAGAKPDLFSADRLAYLMPDAVGDAGRADVLLNLEKLERPFDYTLNIHTPSGEQPRPVDLVETANLVLGLRVHRQRTYRDGAPGAEAEPPAETGKAKPKGRRRAAKPEVKPSETAEAGRKYVTVEATDPAGDATLVVWRPVTDGFDPARDADVLKAMGIDPTTFKRVLVNADAALPGAESIDPLLLAALIQRDPLALSNPLT